MSNFPACKHRKPKSAAAEGLRWLASEPFRVFFFSGAVWSIIGVSLWPLFYAQKLGFYPSIVHARLMIEAFGAAFVVGFLGTAGPRMASAPKLTPLELIWLFALHQAGAISHLRLHHSSGDALFAALLFSLLASLVTRVVRFRKEMPPPQMLLALTGLICGIAGALLMLTPSTLADPQHLRLAGLLLYQGLLLPPVLGIGSFIFPRMLGGDFGEPTTPLEARNKRVRTIAAAALLVGSFFVEAFGWPLVGYVVRAITAAAYLLVEIRWRKAAGDPPRGSLAAGMKWSLVTGFLRPGAGRFLLPAAHLHRASALHRRVWALDPRRRQSRPFWAQRRSRRLLETIRLCALPHLPRHPHGRHARHARLDALDHRFASHLCRLDLGRARRAVADLAPEAVCDAGGRVIT